MSDPAKKEGFRRAQVEKGLVAPVGANTLVAQGEFPTQADLDASTARADRVAAAEAHDSLWDRAEARMEIIKDQRGDRIPGAYESLQGIVSATTGKDLLPDINVDSDAAWDSLNAIPGAGPMIGGVARVEGKIAQAAGKMANDVLPAGASFEGNLYRAVGVGHGPLLIHPGNIAANHRYTGVGQGGLYFATGEYVVEAGFVKNGASLAGKQMHILENQK